MGAPESEAYRGFVALCIVLPTLAASAAVYDCPGIKKYTSEHVYTADELKRFAFSTRVEELPDGAT